VYQGEQLTPWAARPPPVPEIDQLVGALLDPSRSAKIAAGSNPAPATERSSSNATSTWSSTACEDDIETVSSDWGIMPAWQPSFSLVSRAFSSLRRDPHRS
jgi:hypothetical protein